MNLKKTALAAAVSAALIAPMAAQAEATAYGSIRVKLEHSSIEPPVGDDVSDLGVEDVVSRFGLKGSMDLGNGMKAFGHYEFGVDATNGAIFNTPGNNGGNRLGYAGLQGGFGKVALGRQWSPSYLTTGTAVVGIVDGFADGALSLVSSSNAAVPVRSSRALTYANQFGPVTLLTLFQFNNDNGTNQSSDGTYTDQEALDRADIAVKFKAGPATIALSTIQDSEANGDDSHMGASVVFGFGSGHSARVHYESYDYGGADDAIAVNVGGIFSLGGGKSIRAVFGQQTDAVVLSGGTPSDITEIALGFTNQINKATKVWVSGRNRVTEAVASGAETTMTEINTGIRFDF